MRRNSEPFKLLSGVVSDPGRKFPHNEEVKVGLLSKSGNPAITPNSFSDSNELRRLIRV